MSSNGTVVWMSSKEAARYIGVALTTLYRLVDAGKLDAYQPARSLRFRLQDLDDYLERTKVKPGTLGHLFRQGGRPLGCPGPDQPDCDCSDP
jgi:excisionase family DNA binding protein